MKIAEESNAETLTSSQDAGTISQKWIAEHRSIVDKKLSPAVVYWIALTTPNGVPANPLTVHRTLHECGVETLAHQVRQILSQSYLISYKTLKDHKNGFMQDLIRTSYQSSYRNEVHQFIEEPDEIDLDECGVELVVRVVLVKQSFQPSLSAAMSKIEDAKLQIDRFGFNGARVDNAENRGKKEEPQRSSGNLTVLINDIGISMKKLYYVLHRGKIYKKKPASRCTYQYNCDPRAFINILAANEQFKGRLLKDMKRVIDMLSDPY